MTALRDAVRAAGSRLADAGIESSEHDASLLLAHVLGIDLGELRRREIIGHELGDEDAERFEDLVGERARRVPLQHLTGRAPFRRLELQVGPGVFVPRPETEMLVDAVLRLVPEEGRIVDLCTGSGAIALAIASERPDLEVHAVELDEAAAAWAARNIKDLGLDVTLSVEDSREALPGLEGAFDVVVSNPPYVPNDAVPCDPEAAEHDPAVALYGGSANGLALPLAIAERAANLLTPGGHLVMEHADVQGETLPAALLDSRGYEWAHDEQDQAGKPRMTLARREGGSRFEVPTDPADRPRRSRRTVRLVIVDDDGSVLLYRDSDQGLTPPYLWWSTPGGGIDPGEGERTAAVRELFEETGRRAAAEDFVGPLAERTARHGYSDQIITQHDSYYGLRVPRFDAEPVDLTPEEQLTMQEWRWWRPEELRETDDVVWPAHVPQLVGLLHSIVSGATPQAAGPLQLPDVEESSLAIGFDADAAGGGDWPPSARPPQPRQSDDDRRGG